MSTFQNMHRGLNSVNRQARILEAEISMDAKRGVVIPRKQKKLEKFQEQQDTVMNNIIETMKQIAENDKKFLDSFNETIDRINEELEKEEENEEKQTENIKETSLTDNANSSIVDVIIPSTVVTVLPAAKNDRAPSGDDSHVNVSV